MCVARSDKTVSPNVTYIVIQFAIKVCTCYCGNVSQCHLLLSVLKQPVIYGVSLRPHIEKQLMST
jgi:hypothetical protein